MVECNDEEANKVADYQICDGIVHCPNKADEFVTLAGKDHQDIKFVPYYVVAKQHELYAQFSLMEACRS